MEANELRIGNWVNNPIDDIIQVTIIDILNIDHKESYDPVDLTEDWLLKFGFTKYNDQGDSKDYTKAGFKYSVGLDHEDLKLDFITKHGYYCIFYDDKCFKYVHQLQNLYFALTGEELSL